MFLFLTDRRLRHTPAGSLILIDEASMVTMRHLDQLTGISRAAEPKMPPRRGSRVHQAVEGGGGMSMPERKRGSLQLAEPLRFAEPRERWLTDPIKGKDSVMIGASNADDLEWSRRARAN